MRAEYLPERPRPEFLRRVQERIAFHLLEVLAMACEDGSSTDPNEIARHHVVSAAAAMAGVSLENLKALGHATDFRHATHGETLRYVADLCDWWDGKVGIWNDWDDEKPALPCIDERKPVPMPAMPPVRKRPGRRVKLHSVPL